ncbi:MutS-related protein [Nocardia inohanensis]|uniref:MutS-related protein n=1 Tax=Nocardia inohanensis TaxID=209246 RepID=UPI000A0414CA|nr:hypothetical protein [Nocardia inohanensis]
MIPIGLLHPPGQRAQVARNGEAVAEDLGLADLYTAMAAGDEFVADVVKAIVPVSLTDPDVIRYRQDVLADFCADQALLRELYAIAREAASVRRWTAMALQSLEELVGHLRRLRQTCEKHAAGSSAGLTRFREVLAAQLDDEYLSGLEKHLAALYFEHGMLFSAALGTGNKLDRVTLHEPPAATRRSLFGGRSGSSFVALENFEFHDGDPLRIVTAPALAIVKEVVGRVADNVQGFFRELRTELAFYLGCVNLRERLSRAGTPTCFPIPAHPGENVLSARDLRDPLLSLARSEVVGTDIDATATTFTVVTGANSGGKSTFLRSVGCAQLMMQAGLFVTARACTADIRHGLFTHFVRAEDPAMQHGRLDEELARLREITDQLAPHAMVLCNEPFASTNDRDAAAITDPILSALLDSGVKVVLVTHLHDFARQRFAQRHPTDLFLRAERAPDGRRTYRLTPGAPEPTSHGTDIFAQIFGYAPGTNPRHGPDR